ncbi:MAG TPA: hypothetical protein VLZ75_04495 [Chitinophagales bacterium]|nr:hypothetical protein [Chitinophagales bacterium]
MSKFKKTTNNIVEESTSKSFLNSKWMYLIGVLILIFFSITFYLPALSGNSLSAHDYLQGIIMSHNLEEHFKATGEYANWATNMFSGMPSFQIWKSHHNISSWIFDHLFNTLNTYIATGIIAVLCSSLLFYVIGVSPLINIIASTGIILSNFTVISLYAGHNNKVLVMSLVPMTLAGIWLLFEKKKYLLALFIIALSISFQIRLNHVQITYFMGFLVGIWAIFKLFETIKNKDYKHILISLIVLILGLGLGAINNSSQLLTTKEYSEETQRGGPSEVEIAKSPNQVASDGVGYEYATSWSYGILESFTLLIPNFSGGPAVIKKVDDNNEIAKALIQNGVPASNAIQVANQLPTYWGNQPFVAGTTYIGAILIYLMFLGFFIIRDNKRWWLLTAFFVTLFIAWGNNFSIFYKFLFNYLPYFNKFRTPSMVFYLTTIIVAITAALTLQQIYGDRQNREVYWNHFYKASIGFIGFMVVLTLLGPSIFSFVSESVDGNLKVQLLQMTQNNSQMSDAIYGGLLSERKSMMRMDALRSTVFIVLTAGLVATFLKRKLSGEIMLTGIIILILFDIVGVDKRYVNYDSFTDEIASKSNFRPSAADSFILQDTSDYRVLDLTVNSFSEAKPSYFHKNIGGYHSVKLKRYQDIISYQINDNIQQLSNGNVSGAQVLNMLNTKYVITSPETTGVFKNEFAYGNAWLVNDIKVLNGSVEVFDNLMKEDLSKTALLEKPNATITQSQTLPFDSAATIDLFKADNDVMIYRYQSSVPSYAVFSEVYYNSGKGWTAYIDNQAVEQDEVNYVLRGLSLPAGNHEIVFKFDTPTLQLANKLDYASSIVIVLLGIGIIVLTFIQKIKEKTSQNNV